MSGAATHIVYVHGLWLNGAESLILRRRIQRRLDAPVHTFHYHSVTSGMPDIAAKFDSFVRDLGAQTLHLVGHSLGGLVIYRFLERYPDQPPGRVVFLGTPAVASRAAVAAMRLRWAQGLMGHCVAEELSCQHARRWNTTRELGIIAGTRNVGLGQLLAHFGEASDGTVAVSETRLPGATDHRTLPVSHMGMLLSAQVARETAFFLRHGRFSLRP